MDRPQTKWISSTAPASAGPYQLPAVGSRAREEVTEGLATQRRTDQMPRVLRWILKYMMVGGGGDEGIVILRVVI